MAFLGLSAILHLAAFDFFLVRWPDFLKASRTPKEETTIVDLVKEVPSAASEKKIVEDLKPPPEEPSPSPEKAVPPVEPKPAEVKELAKPPAEPEVRPASESKGEPSPQAEPTDQDEAASKPKPKSDKPPPSPKVAEKAAKDGVKPKAKPTPKKAKTKQADKSGPQPIAGLSEAAASRLLGQRLGREPDQAVPIQTDEELVRYINTAKSKILGAWKPYGRAMGAVNVAIFAIRVEANGRVSRVQLSKSSGNPDFDLTVERAVKKASPFPPLPSVFGGQSQIMDLAIDPREVVRRK